MRSRFLGFLLLTFCGAQMNAASPPNVLLVVADDLGYGDLGCFGHSHIETPNLDRLAAGGLKLTRCYSASAVCSPARAAIMTGRTPSRAGIYHQLIMMDSMHLRQSEVTLPALLKRAGYVTAQVGKWHLNSLFNLPGQPQPNDLGFDHWFAVHNNALPNHRNPYNFVRNGIPQGRIEGYSGPIVAREAVEWLTSLRDKSKPFFLYVAFNEPHEPIATDASFRARYEKKFPDDPSRVAYYGNVSQMDDSVGRILAALDQQGLTENTVVWFTSDNGPARTKWHNVGSKAGFRAYKGHLYEGGLRVPGIIRWPARIKPGSVCDEAVSGVDMLPTLVAASDVVPPVERPLDGVNIANAFAGGLVVRQKPLYWEYIYAASRPQVALQSGGWKILAALDGRRPLQAAHDEIDMQLLKSAPLTGFELYDLQADPGETTDLASTRAEKLKEMRAALEKMHADVQADAPVWPSYVNSHYEDSRIEWPTYLARPLMGEKLERKPE